MRTRNVRDWSKEDDNYLRKHASDGTVKLSAHFGVSLAVIRRRCSSLGIEMKLNKAEIKPIKETKMDNSEKFNPNRHKIRNNSTAGKIPFYIKSEKMTVYLDPKKATQKHKDAIVNKFANRHKPIT